MLWPGARHLAQFLAHEGWGGKRTGAPRVFCELGAGTGLCGVASVTGGYCIGGVLTDGDEDSIDLARRNTDANDVTDVHVQRLLWGDKDHIAATRTTLEGIPPAGAASAELVVLAADVVDPCMEDKVCEELVDTVVALMQGSAWVKSSCLCCFVDRDYCRTFRRFVRFVSDAGLAMELHAWEAFCDEAPLMDAKLLRLTRVAGTEDGALDRSEKLAILERNEKLAEGLYQHFRPPKEAEEEEPEDPVLAFADAEDSDFEEGWGERSFADAEDSDVEEGWGDASI
mmetsp:Transcript_25734/g.80582  ORF Transcript_25734/g.80582 Transcript_25734/m.80582 type:complete len:284 (-) Transcript_25734:245-1096(-)